MSENKKIVMICTRVTSETRQKLKVMAAKDNKTIQELLNGLIDGILKNKTLPK